MTDESQEERTGRPFLPNHLVEEIGMIFLVTGVILVLASLLKPEQVSLPHIYFAGVQEMMRAVAPWFATVVLILLVLFLLAIPFLDRSEERHPFSRWIFVVVVFAIIAMWIAFTIVGF